jgi:serine/threonine-protein kinase SRPK3
MYDSNDTCSSSDISEYDDIDVKGLILNDKYVVLSQIGSGASSSVWLTYDLIGKQMHALKIQNVDDYNDGLDEIDILKKTTKINCPYLPNLIDNFIFTSDIGDHVCMVLNLMACSLNDILNKKNGKYSDGFPLKSSIKIIIQLITAAHILYFKHKIIHTDIKPENILLQGVNKSFENMINIFSKNNLESKIKKKIKKKQNIKNIIEKWYPHSQFNSDSESNVELNLNIIDEKYINNCKIVLSDYGNAIPISDIRYEEIQTRHYRAPEVILGYKYDHKCDVWSIACTFYELLTGEVLFFPEKSRGINTDRQHIYEIQKLFGKLPNALLDKSKKKNIFYKKNGLMKRRTAVVYEPFENKLLNLFEKINISPSIKKNINVFFTNTFEIDPAKRWNFSQCHDWVQTMINSQTDLV